MRDLALLRTRADFHAADGVLLIVRPPPLAKANDPTQPPSIASDATEGDEILLAVWDDGRATALHGHVDLGTGLATALAQIVGDELDLPMRCVDVILGDTARAPNQGPTIASASIQNHAHPLRAAAAQARAWLLDEAAQHLATSVDALQIVDGLVLRRDDPTRHIGYAQLLRGRHVELVLDAAVRIKEPSQRRLVRTEVPRVDIPAKAFGTFAFVHDLRMPGLLHGRVVRPPYVGVDAGDFVGRTLESVDETSIAHLDGIVAVVAEGDFVGIVAEREEAAEAAMHALAVHWKPWPGMRPLDDMAHAIRANPATRRTLVERGNVDTASAAVTMDRTYLWPYQLHASIGPSCAVALWQGPPPLQGEGRGEDGCPSPTEQRHGPTLTVWAATQNPHTLRADLATLTGLAAPDIEVIRMEGAGCYGRNGADDVAADAALLSRAVRRPVRVQLTREQEHLWEPKGAAQLMEVRGGLAADGTPAAYDFTTAYPSNAAPTLALLLTRAIEPEARALQMGDRTAVPPYTYDNLRVAALDMAPLLRASWLRGVSALPNAFAHESYIDELATEAGIDPVAFRLRHLDDPRAVELVRATTDRAGWIPHDAPQRQSPAADGRLKGQGFAYARYVHSKFPGFGAAWSAWVADVEVDPATGDVHVSRVVVGHDAGLEINPAGVRHQIHGNVVQTTSRALKEQVALDATTHLPVSREWGSYPILRFADVPVIDIVRIPRPDEPPLGVGESSSVPGTAAIANAIFDATGVRFRAPPFTAEVVREGMARAVVGRPLPGPLPDGEGVTAVAPSPLQGEGWGGGPPPKEVRLRKGLVATLTALAGAALTLLAAAFGYRPTIAPVAPSTTSIYSADVIARGRTLSAIGNCIGCHTVEGGARGAGGRPIATPFGAVISTNLTPDPDTGIGLWSFSAFQRAMREGVSRDGHFLYPAFPYTAFTRTSDDDLTALYAFLMSEPAVRSRPTATTLAFPFNVRPLMALWNALFLDVGPKAVTGPSAAWQRGRYLVDGLGHCGACHTPRNAMGAEREQARYLDGAMVDGWEAPALTRVSQAPLPWDEDELYRYLRTGHTRSHGGAGGPMIEVVRNLGLVPDDDVRAMATYLASFSTATVDAPARAAQLVDAHRARHDAATASPVERFFIGACGACHHDGAGPQVFGQNLALDLNTNLASDRPDNLVRVILDGIREPASRDTGFMPGFRDSLDDRQVADLVNWMRDRYAPERPAWNMAPETVTRMRQ